MNGFKKCAIVGLVLVAGVAWGQVEVEWERTYGSPNPYRRVINEGGSYAIGGSWGVPGAFDANLCLLRIAPNGDSLSSVVYGTEVWDVPEDLSRSDDGYSFATLASNDGDIFRNGLMKLSLAGDSLCSYYEDSYSDTTSTNYFVKNLQIESDIFQLADKHDLIHQSYAFRLMNFDETLDLQFERSYQISRYGMPFDMCLFGRDTLAVLWASGGDSPVELFVTLLDLGGDSLSTFCVPAPNVWGWGGNLQSANINLLPDNHLLLSMYFVSVEKYAKSTLSGDTLWTKYYSLERRDWEPPQFLSRTVVLQDGGFITLIGSSRTLLRCDDQGDSLWASHLTGYPYDFCKCEDGGYLLVGLDDHWAGTVVKTTPDPVYVSNRPTLSPYNLHISPAYPNPFNGTTRIGFDVGPTNRGATSLAVYDPLGRRVVDLIPASSGTLNLRAGRHEVIWNAVGMPSGYYLVRLQAGGEVVQRGVVLGK